MGGIGQERDISIQSGSCVAQALKETGLNVITADIRPDDMRVLDDRTIDVFFIALHGSFGEDGRLQQILEDRGLVYTGSGPAASRLAFDKMASKKVFAKAGLATPAAVEFNPGTKNPEAELRRLADKFVIKPLRQGSTIGVTIADDPNSALSAAEKCFNEFGECMIEQFIAGREITVGILENRPLPIIEIRTKNGFYDYHAKYIDESTQFLFDTIDDPKLVAKINQAALACFDALGCRSFARVDFILAGDENPCVLEVNTIPGFTTHSLLPKAAAKAGLSMGRLCLKVIEAAYSLPVTRKSKIANRKTQIKSFYSGQKKTDKRQIQKDII